MPKPVKKKQQREIRLSTKPQKFEIRKNSDGTRSVSGYFATFGTMSHDLGFREVLKKGCFADSLASKPVACYRDHNPEMLLGKTQSGTLSVAEDDKGLKFSVKLPDTTYANDLISLMERADAYECSFGFSVADSDGDVWSQLPDGQILRTIAKAVLYEGSILTGPPAAYPNTSADLRSCPLSLRSKLKRDDNENLDVCNPDSEDYDPDACDEDDDNDEDRCSCRCEACAGCTNQDETRRANLDLLRRRLLA